MMRNKKKFLVSLLTSLALLAGLFAALPAFAAGTELFPNGGLEGDGPAWTAQGGTPTVSTDEAHEGSKSLKISGLWSRMTLRDGDSKTLFDSVKAGLTEGKIYELSAWIKAVKNSGQEQVTGGAHLVLTGQSPNYPTARAHLFGGEYFYISDADWVQKTSKIGFVKQSDGTIGIYSDGKFTATNLTDLLNFDIDLGSGADGYFYFDDISMTESSATKNVTITLRDNGVAATGKTIIIKDSSGASISPQPTIEENEGVYTVKNLTFANLTTTYLYEIEGVAMADGVIDATKNAFERDLTSYSAVVTVQDESGTPISDANVTATAENEPVSVVNGGDGTYTVSELYSDVEFTVGKEGLIPKTITLTASSKTATVILKRETAATVVQGSLISNGNFEEELVSGTMSPGNWFGDAAAFARTTNDQQDGKYGLYLNGSEVAYRLDAAQIAVDGSKTYVLTGAFKSDLAGTVTAALRITGTDGNNYCYPRQTIFTDSLTADFKVLRAAFGVEYDEIEKTLTFVVDGERTAFEGTVDSIAAIDFVFASESGKPVYIDNLFCLESYDLQFTVRDGGTEITSGVTFAVEGYDGKVWDVAPVYSEGKWRIPDACGVVKVTATVGTKTLPTAVFDAKNPSAVIESGFDLTVNLKDAYGNALSGATIVAKKGSTELFTLTDNGDGSYSYSGASGSFNLYVTLEGHTFSVERNVDSSRATVTITATSSPENGDKENDNKTGCACGAVSGDFGTTAGGLLLIGFAAVVWGVFGKKQKN